MFTLRQMRLSRTLAAVALLASTTVAQSCVSLSGSSQCAGFDSSSVSTTGQVQDFFPFLSFVSNVEEFDRELARYVSQGYVSSKYVNLFGCDNINLSNTTDYYARYTTTFLCNAIIQNSRDACSLTDETAPPMCADSCADFALSEESIVGSNELCSGRSGNYAQQLRADFTDCYLPTLSISGSCISGEDNEPDECGFQGNLMGLCNFCRGSPENGTDSCCLTSNATGRCENVELPVFSSIPGLVSTPTSSPTASSTATSGSNNDNDGGAGGGGGLSGGEIAGIVIGSVLGFLLLLAALIFCCIFLRRRNRDGKQGSLLNQPSPQRRGNTASTYPAPPSSQQGYEVLPGGRVARMSALQDNEGPRNYTANTDRYGDSPDSNEKAMGMIGARKHDSPGSKEASSPSSNDFSSPEGMASGQSEQLPFFKDYYSNEDIHPGDKVATLWAYQPRAGDEFELERGDMLKVVGIWDDGWATGVRISDRAEDFEGKHKAQRDSGVSNGSRREDSPTPPGEIKAFPLVCVCLPEAWRKTVEGDTSTESGSGGPPTA
ncbi:uncharacterized protein HMPREF1541_09936 [Cyphellophora europaea CBS 101466]|uniref:SH3 domain-containing protein n=1 Tax=Cyphellophora europaea (strain CBS 101466) TaxID=1220924 RepID=W2S8V0_CYPE1|nr:uncharacterized protein HMPREF1541_09936 [Cyphellophora europaea CBS 101466]ETN45060.1 hypothetical protein HMPREF1541_09936 [Cyphellophora europaea CBS 101466]